MLRKITTPNVNRKRNKDDISVTFHLTGIESARPWKAENPMLERFKGAGLFLCSYIILEGEARARRRRNYKVLRTDCERRSRHNGTGCHK